MTVSPEKSDSTSPSGFLPTGMLLGFTAVLTALLLIPLARVWELAPDLGHGWAAPILMAYLWWERWDSRPVLKSEFESVGLSSWLILALLFALIIPLRLILTPYPLWPLALTLYLGLLVGLVLYVAGRLSGATGVRWLAGPLSILIGVIPWPGAVERVLILPLREGIASLVTEISNLLGSPALASGTSVRLANGWVGIDEACGGIRSLQAAITTALFFGEWLQLSLSRRIGLLLGGGLAAVVGNFGRVLFLSWCATGSEGMLDRWHDVAGWSALGFTLVVTGLLGWLWRNSARQTSVRKTRSGVKFVPHRPLLVWLGIAAIGLLFVESGTRWWFAHGESCQPAQKSRWSVQLPANNPSFQELPLTKVAEELLRPDDFESGYWFGPDGVQRSVNYIQWHEGQVARSAPFLHNPTVCLPYAGCELVEVLGVVNVSWKGGSIPFHTYLFRRINEDMLVAFTIWDPSRGQLLKGEEEGWGSWWRAQWRDVLDARQHQPAQLLSFAIIGRDDRQLLVDELSQLILQADSIRRSGVAK